MTDLSALVKRLRDYRPTNEWGDPVRHVIADEAADAITDLMNRNEALAAELVATKARTVSIPRLKSFDELFQSQKDSDHA